MSYIDPSHFFKTLSLLLLCGHHLSPRVSITEALSRKPVNKQPAHIGHTHQAHQHADDVPHQSGPDLDPEETTFRTCSQTWTCLIPDPLERLTLVKKLFSVIAQWKANNNISSLEKLSWLKPTVGINIVACEDAKMNGSLSNWTSYHLY